ncbi:hypothetical protein M0R45_034422 [Rubus argutus]|uniref:glucan endo-1,3-beta-D-glucosidase n=1 Tax=Rubus argutus TaxID=59490 RepID=A0AAW1VUF0_RUBAR
MGGQCSKLIPCCGDSQFKAAVLEAPVIASTPLIPRSSAPSLYSNTTLILTIPNPLVPLLAANCSNALRWLYVHIVPFFPRTKIFAISVGNDLLEPTSEFSQFLLPAIWNVHSTLLDLGIRKIAVSTTFSFVNVVMMSFLPSAASSPPIQTLLSLLVSEAFVDLSFVF